MNQKKLPGASDAGLREAFTSKTVMSNYTTSVVGTQDASASAAELAPRIRIGVRRVLSWRADCSVRRLVVSDLTGYRQTRTWEADVATAKQLAALRRLGFSVLCALTKGEAAYLIARSIELRQTLARSVGHGEKYPLKLPSLRGNKEARKCI